MINDKKKLVKRLNLYINLYSNIKLIHEHWLRIKMIKK